MGNFGTKAVALLGRTRLCILHVVLVLLVMIRDAPVKEQW